MNTQKFPAVRVAWTDPCYDFIKSYASNKEDGNFNTKRNEIGKKYR